MPHAATDRFAARIARVAGPLRAHPAAVIVSVVALALGTVAIVAGWTVAPPSAVAGGPPAPPPRRGSLLAGGPLSLEAADSRGRYVAVDGDAGILAEVGAASAVEARRAATFTAMPGLADEGCLSLRAADGRFLRDVSGRLRVSAADQGAQFRRDATFCVRGGFVRGAAALEALGRRGRLVRHVGDQMRVEPGDELGASFLIRPPLG